jgi:hypothetical protein
MAYHLNVRVAAAAAAAAAVVVVLAVAVTQFSGPSYKSTAAEATSGFDGVQQAIRERN